MGSTSAVRVATLDHAQLRTGERVLDVGCGPGTLTLMAKERAGFGDVTGIDASPEMIQRANEKAAKVGVDVTFQHAVIEELPFPDASFDLVLSSFMLHHLPEEVKESGLREVARVLKLGGRLLAVDLTGRGSLVWKVIALFGHKLPADYADRLSDVMRTADLRPLILESNWKAYVFIRATREA
jgi:demethylmenaquinone methyltransferase/2-methoxy-6-polyprenyl-1,4-benzoquinol methylase/phosphoethanolamine N-methyltransferase